MANRQIKIHAFKLYPLVTPKERLLAWEKVRGMWKKRKPEPIQELKKIRKEWKRKLPSLSR